MIKAGILGGGQLGRMLLQKAADFPVETWVMENDADCPAAHLCHHFVQGDIRDFDAVYAFGKQVEVLTIEIENVNLDALEKLENEGLRVVPKVAALRKIKSKILQKEMYAAAGIPSPEFVVTQNRLELSAHAAFLPAAHKLATGGYDGKGVEILESEADLHRGYDGPSVLEKKVNIAKEIALMIAVNAEGKMAIYPPVEMLFNPQLNLLDFQLAPAELAEKTFWRAEAIAIQVVKALQSEGLFAIEMFVTPEGDVLVNETAPRVHNSGHHTIEASYCSQYEMLWRLLLNLPLGLTDNLAPSALLNLLGEGGQDGTVQYEGLKEVMAMEKVYVHLYGKKQTKPGRKMGHVTMLGTDRNDLMGRASRIKNIIKVKAQQA